jgi:hypothetical protein
MEVSFVERPPHGSEALAEGSRAVRSKTEDGRMNWVLWAILLLYLSLLIGVLMGILPLNKKKKSPHAKDKAAAPK